jgi:mRNA degradation ribonuclease J1/J2
MKGSDFIILGSFGTILYTGDFRYDPVMLENKVLAHVMENEVCKWILHNLVL